MKSPTDCRDGGDDLAELQLVQDRGLTRRIETNLRCAIVKHADSSQFSSN